MIRDFLLLKNDIKVHTFYAAPFLLHISLYKLKLNAEKLGTLHHSVNFLNIFSIHTEIIATNYIWQKYLFFFNSMYPIQVCN
jgi:hypothetical protein